MNRARRGTKRRRHSTAVTVVAAITAVTAGLVGARTIDALFYDTATARLDVTVAPPAIPAPAGVTCATQGTVLAKVARLSWTAPAGGETPTAYAVMVNDGTNVVEVKRVGGTVLTTDVGGALLIDAIGYLLDLLLGGQQLPVTVVAVYGNYRSTPTFSHRLRWELGVLSGVGCTSGAALNAGRAAATTTTTSTTPSTTVPATSTSEPAVPATTVPEPTTTQVETTTVATTSTAAPPTTPTTSPEPDPTTTVPGPTTTTLVPDPAPAPSTTAA